MKRGKDDDKIMGPMFPRLHINDTEKGGPRAPPRNKMALYEQLTIPSQRQNIGAVPLNLNNNRCLGPSSSMNQGMGRERNINFPFYRPSLAPSSEELQVHQSEDICMTNEPAQVENSKKPREEDDFMVPIFSQPSMQGRTQDSKDGGIHSHLNSTHSLAHSSYGNKQTNNSSSGGYIPRQHVMNQDGGNMSVSDAPTRFSDILRKEHEKQRLSSMEKTDVRIHQDHKGNQLSAESRYREGASESPLKITNQGTSLRQKHNSHVGYRYEVAHKVDKGRSMVENVDSLGKENTDRGHAVSEVSMLDSVAEVDLSPDDVVGVIGQKHFWKARNAIVNQQRVFAVQVFELHRLIQVQKLIAGSPDLLLEGSAFVDNNSLKDSALKKYPSESVAKDSTLATKQPKGNSQKVTDKIEGSAENAVAKLPFPPSQDGSHPKGGHPSQSVNPESPPPVNTDPRMNPWSFQQPPVHQWLVPVMSPSEGLVYKPYPAPGMMGGPMCGGCGPQGPTPLMGNLMNPSPYGIPNPHYHHHHQGMGVPPPAPHFGGQGYFPAYAMPAMSASVSGSAVDQINQFSGPNNPHAQMNQPAAVSTNHSLQHQSSCNMPINKKATIAADDVMTLHRKEGELQGSTASSPAQRTHETTVRTETKKQDAFSLFPTVLTDGAPSAEKLSRVIRVVPHNPRSTRESAARIFQSIQAERRGQYEST